MDKILKGKNRSQSIGTKLYTLIIIYQGFLSKKSKVIRLLKLKNLKFPTLLKNNLQKVKF